MSKKAFELEPGDRVICANFSVPIKRIEIEDPHLITGVYDDRGMEWRMIWEMEEDVEVTDADGLLKAFLRFAPNGEMQQDLEGNLVFYPNVG